MAIFKCKMCGGNLEVAEGSSVVTCEYCGTNQTVSKTKDEVVANLYNRANDLRIKCEFDRAEQTYEKILEQDNTESEAHWGIVLCRYGIEYVKDPYTGKRIPTCHRASYEAITTDADYIAAMENADSEQREIYAQEARTIGQIQKNILDIVKNEEPFDVFICYKETDENGKRTPDSAIANDIYYQLTQEGFKVFYAPITLEDKLGREYEPYIFAALNSARVMLVVGTKPEHFDAVWVRNEWSRYIKLIRNDRSRLLIPCYRDMDAYDLPDEFAHLQAQDMSKIGFMSDVVRGIKKLLTVENQNTVQNVARSQQTVIKAKQIRNNVSYYVDANDCGTTSISKAVPYDTFEKILIIISAISLFVFSIEPIFAGSIGIVQLIFNFVLGILYAIISIRTVFFKSSIKSILFCNVLTIIIFALEFFTVFAGIVNLGLLSASLLSLLFVAPRVFGRKGAISKIMAAFGTVCFCLGAFAASLLIAGDPDLRYTPYLILGLVPSICLAFANWPRQANSQ